MIDLNQGIRSSITSTTVSYAPGTPSFTGAQELDSPLPNLVRRVRERNLIYRFVKFPQDTPYQTLL